MSPCLSGSLAGQGVLTGALLGVNADVSSMWLAMAAISLACVCHLGVIVSYGLTVTSGIPDTERGLATGLVTTSSDLLTGLRTVIAVEPTIVPAAAVLVALGLRGSGADAEAVDSAAAEVEALDAR